MRGKFTTDYQSLLASRLTNNEIYEILGVSNASFYYIIDDNNDFISVPKKWFTIIDNIHPKFWIIDPTSENRIVPEQWHFKNFLYLSRKEIDDIGNREVWTETQFLKGLIHYDLDSIPNNLLFARDDIAKENIIRSILKTLEYYANQFRDNYSPYLDCDFCNFKDIYESGESGIYENNKQIGFTDEIYNEEKATFENLKDILSDILKFPITKDRVDYNNRIILNRLIYSIWSIFQTKNIQIILRKYRHSYPEFILKTNDKCYKLIMYQDE
jgi:hypothetical protein